MLQQVIEIRTDDLGSAGEASPTRFSFKGVEYEIDLNKRNTETFERHMERWIGAARPVTKKPRVLDDARSEIAAIRAWAAENGIHVGARGRIPDAVKRSYREAQSES